MQKNTFPKSNKLKSRKKLEALFAHGKSIRRQSIRLIYSIDAANTEAQIECGVGASGKVFKRAVDRNRIKRLLREAFRLQQQEIKQAAEANNITLSLFLLFTGKEMPVFHNIFTETGAALKKLSETINATNL